MKKQKSLFETPKNLEENPNEKNNRVYYTKKISAPIYKVTGNKPQISELYDNSKTRELFSKIKNANVTEEERKFLLSAAHRFTKFSFKDIADFYPHATKDMQEIMEDLALIIVDYDKAIEKGFLVLEETTKKQYEEELQQSKRKDYDGDITK